MATGGEENTHIPNIIVSVCPSPSQSEAPAFTQRVIIVYPKGRMQPSLALIRGDRRGEECCLPPVSQRLQGGAPFTVQTMSVSHYQ